MVRITCGMYGWMCHTRFFGNGDEAESECRVMKQALENLIELAFTPVSDADAQVVVAAIEAFVERSPYHLPAALGPAGGLKELDVNR